MNALLQQNIATELLLVLLATASAGIIAIAAVVAATKWLSDLFLRRHK